MTIQFSGPAKLGWNFAEELFSFSQSFRYYVGGSDESSDEFGSSEGYFGDDAAGIPKIHRQVLITIMITIRQNYLEVILKQNNLFAKAIRKKTVLLPDQII